MLQTGGVPADGLEGVKTPFYGEFFAPSPYFAKGDKVETSLHSGSIDSVQTGEAKLHLFEAVDKG